MENKFESFQEKWKSRKQPPPPGGPGAMEMLRLARNSQRQSNSHHYWNISILSVVVVVLSWFFYYKAPMQDLISRVGIVLMIGGLLVRIAIEWISRIRNGRIRYSSATKETAAQAAKFYHWRKKIHGPVTITILILYSVGFFLLTPEFARHLPMKWVIIMDVSFVPIAIMLFFSIRSGIRKEMKQLRVLTELETELEGGE